MTSFHLLRNEAARSLLSPLTTGRASNYIRPTIAALYITRHCNSRCTMCDFWKNEHDPKELTSEQWGVVFSRLKAFGVDFVGVNASGEMFTRRDVFDILGHLRDLDMGFGVNSNGTLFTPARAKRLAVLGPRHVTIGLDGVGDGAYLATRGLKNGFTKVSRHIDNLKREGIKNIGIGTVLMAQNVSQWVELAKFALEKRLAGVRFTAHHDSYFTLGSEMRVSVYNDPGFLDVVQEEIEKLIELKRRTGIVKNSENYLRHVCDFYRDPQNYFPVPCLQGSNRIEIDVYGNVTLCSFVTEPLGNLVGQEMEDIWNSEVHRRAREDAYRGRCPKCFLSCYEEENLRLSARGFLPTFANSVKRGVLLLGPQK
ncbi:radical SAM protein [Methylocaldum sp. BRCS4]|jgi:MoaA/NifB/PqqE/SkfB family radical SAM enzyme|nr:radical SAM protein [Methylocaldum sp. BRCS4]